MQIQGLRWGIWRSLVVVRSALEFTLFSEAFRHYLSLFSLHIRRPWKMWDLATLLSRPASCRTIEILVSTSFFSGHANVSRDTFFFFFWLTNSYVEFSIKMTVSCMLKCWSSPYSTGNTPHSKIRRNPDLQHDALNLYRHSLSSLYSIGTSV